MSVPSINRIQSGSQQNVASIGDSPAADYSGVGNARNAISSPVPQQQKSHLHLYLNITQARPRDPSILLQMRAKNTFYRNIYNALIRADRALHKDIPVAIRAYVRSTLTILQRAKNPARLPAELSNRLRNKRLILERHKRELEAILRRWNVAWNIAI